MDIPTVPKDCVGCQYIKQVITPHKLLSLARRSGLSVCTFDPHQNAWLIAESPFDEVRAVPDRDTEPRGVYEERKASASEFLRQEFSARYGNDLGMERLASELFAALEPMIDYAGTSQLRALMMPLETSAANQSVAEVQRAIVTGFAVLGTGLPRTIRDDDDWNPSDRHGVKIHNFVHKALAAIDAAFVPSPAANLGASQVAQGWREMASLLNEAWRLIHKGDADALARLADPAWINAGEKLVPGWRERTSSSS